MATSEEEVTVITQEVTVIIQEGTTIIIGEVEYSGTVMVDTATAETLKNTGKAD
jgi:hypothetical protein